MMRHSTMNDIVSDVLAAVNQAASDAIKKAAKQHKATDEERKQIIEAVDDMLAEHGIADYIDIFG